MKKRLLIGVLVLVMAFFVTACGGPDAEQSSAAPTGTAVLDVEDSKAKDQSLTQPYYVMIIGNDSRNRTVESKGNDDQGRADAMMIARIDPATYQISLLTIPRDTPIEVDGKTYKMNRPYNWKGPEYAVQIMEEFTGLDIKYYIDLGMAEFVDFYNEIGGVDVNVPADIYLKDIMTGDRIDLSAGNQHLNGNQALVLSRVRKMYTWGDPCRQYNSRHMMENTILMCAADPALAAANLDILLKHADTNWPKEELAAQITDFCEHADQIHFQEGTGPYEGGTNEETGDWMCLPNPEVWAEVLKVFAEGGDPTTVQPLAPFD